MSFLTDFTKCRSSNLLYGGNAGLKAGIEVDGKNWIVKYPQDTASFEKVDISFTTAPLSEYIGSHIYSILGYNTHNTRLGISFNEYFNRSQLVVACEDFTENGRYKLVDYETIKNNYSDLLQAKLTELSQILPKYEHSGISQHTLPIEEIVLQFTHNMIFNMCPEVKELFWDMIIVDCLINNNDRNKNNWGLLQDLNSNVFKPAPVYDNGASFVSKHSDEKLKRLLANEAAFNNSVLNGLCYYTIDNKLVNFKNFFSKIKQTEMSPYLENAAKRVIPVITDRFTEIKAFIELLPNTEDGIEIISDIKKQFFIKSMEVRIERILMNI